MGKQIGVGLVWALVCFASFFLFLLGRHFLHDDLAMVHYNVQVSGLHSVWDSLFFPLQLTKPVTNSILALSLYLSNFSVFGQRLTSLLLHSAVVIAWYAILSRETQRNPSFPRSLPWVTTLLFAVAPIHSETIGIAQFRGEILASLFTLIAWWLAPHVTGSRSRVALAGVLICLVLATLSKEIYFVVCLAMVLLEIKALRSENLLSQKKRFNALFCILLTAASIAAVIYGLVMRESDGPFSYLGNVGFSIMPFGEWVSTSSRALLEGVWKTISGHGLTTVRLSTRYGLGKNFPIFAHCLILAIALGSFGYLLRKCREERALLLAAALPILIYLGIPNSNAGSEHYWYFAAAPTFALLYLAGARAISSEKILVGLGVTYAVLLFIGLQSRALDYRDRISFYDQELASHPESSWPWVNRGLIEAEEQHGWAAVEKYFSVADKLQDPIFMIPQRLGAALAMKDLDAIDRYLNEAYRKGFRGRGLSTLFTRAALISLEKGRVLKALAAARTAQGLFPQNPLADRIVNKIEASVYRRLPLHELRAESESTETSNGT